MKQQINGDTASSTWMGWLIYAAIRFVALVFSRFLLLVIVFSLLIPLLLIASSFSDSDLGSWLFFVIWTVALWPWALTGRSEFTEADFGILVTGWSALVLIVTYVFAKFFPSFKFPTKRIIQAATLLFAVAAAFVLLGPAVQPPDRGGILSFLGFAYGGFLFSVFMFWTFDKVASTVKPKRTKVSILR